MPESREDRIRRTHRRGFDPRGGHQCRRCRTPWPCDATFLLERADEVRERVSSEAAAAERERIRAAAEALEGTHRAIRPHYSLRAILAEPSDD